MRLWFVVAALAVVTFFLFSATAAMFLTEGALHPARRLGAAKELGAVEIEAGDGVRLREWFRRPANANGGCVILLHGIGDSHLGVEGLADFLVPAGFGALMPDLRGHGVSEGAVATYGVLEREDVSRWLDWLRKQSGCDRLYGQGQSLGGSILISSLLREKRLQAVVADSPYFSFSSIARERVARQTGVPAPLAAALAILVVCEGEFYARVRYGFNLEDAAPAPALYQSHTRVLLIHGLADDSTSPENSIRLRAVDPARIQLWLVPGARHVGSFAAAPEGYKRRVLGWFAGGS